MLRRTSILYYSEIYDLNCWFEKLHRYVFDYCYQSDNEDWGAYTPYKRANASNPYRKWNPYIEAFYTLIKPLFKGWRDKLEAEYPHVRKYQRYYLEKSNL